MEVEQLVSRLLIWGVYPLWLLAGGIDYLCHRRTRIEVTAGPMESMLHVAEFLVLGAALTVMVLFTTTRWTFSLVAACVLLHSVLACIDVSFTTPRRYISPLEQSIHGLLDVLPLAALALMAISNWDALRDDTLTVTTWNTSLPLQQQLLLLGSYFLLSGAPVMEELIRTLRYAGRLRATTLASLP